MVKHDVFINSRPKARQSTMCIVIKGIEKFITNIYDARHELLKLTSDRIIAEIPQTYYGPNDMANFKDSSIAKLVASSMTYSSMSPITVPPMAWPNISPEMSWRSRVPPPASPLTTSMLQQHNQITSNMQVPSINVSDLHTSGYSTYNSESSMMKLSMNGSHISSLSPENSLSYGSKYPQGMQNIHESPLQNHCMRNQMQMNDPMYSLDPRIIAGIRAMGISPHQSELRTPNSNCK